MPNKITTIEEFKKKCKDFINVEEAFNWLTAENITKELVIEMLNTYGFDVNGNYKMSPKEAVELIYKEAKDEN